MWNQVSDHHVGKTVVKCTAETLNEKPLYVCVCFHWCTVQSLEKHLLRIWWECESVVLTQCRACSEKGGGVSVGGGLTDLMRTCIHYPHPAVVSPLHSHMLPVGSSSQPFSDFLWTSCANPLFATGHETPRVADETIPHSAPLQYLASQILVFFFFYSTIYSFWTAYINRRKVWLFPSYPFQLAPMGKVWPISHSSNHRYHKMEWIPHKDK